MQPDKSITSLQNPEIKQAVRLRKRSERDEQGRFLVEGYRELLRALDNGWRPEQVFYCQECFLGSNEWPLLEKARATGALLVECTEPVFKKAAYRERPEGLLAVGPSWSTELEQLDLSSQPLVLVAESIEKPGNLGTMLRTADAAGADALIVCDPRTDIFNPNVVRASIGTLFTIPVVQASTESTLDWLRQNRITSYAATPHTERLYYEADLAGPSAIVMGTEQVGLTDAWIKGADESIRIPMLGQADSLNVAAATTILLFEAVRQRGTA